MKSNLDSTFANLWTLVGHFKKTNTICFCETVYNKKINGVYMKAFSKLKKS